MNWSEAPFHPAPKILRQFAGAWLVFVLGIAAHQWLGQGHPQWALLLAGLAVGLGGMGLLWPGAIRWLYVGMMVLAFPIGWTVSQLILLLMFYGLITPLAWLMRLRGRDLLQRQPNPNQASYWRLKESPNNLRRYFRQY